MCWCTSYRRDGDESQPQQNTSKQGAVGEGGHCGWCLCGCLGGRALCPGPRGTSSRMSRSIRCEDDPGYPCGVWLVQLYLIGQEQRAALHQGVWHSVDIRVDPQRLVPLRFSLTFSDYADVCFLRWEWWETCFDEHGIKYQTILISLFTSAETWKDH